MQWWASDVPQMVPLHLESAPPITGPSVLEFVPKGRLLLTATIAMVGKLNMCRFNEHKSNCLADSDLQTPYTNSQLHFVHFAITANFNNRRTPKFKAQPTNAFSATVNEMFGGSSQLPIILSELP